MTIISKKSNILLKLGDTRLNNTCPLFLFLVHPEIYKSGKNKIGLVFSKNIVETGQNGGLGRGGYRGAFGHQLGVAAAFLPIKQLHGIHIVQFLLTIAPIETHNSIETKHKVK